MLDEALSKKLINEFLGFFEVVYAKVENVFFL
jgi:hypothetical protein